MKKNEILKLIELNEMINKNSQLLAITKHKKCGFLIDKKDWLPNIEELKKEFKILEDEVQIALDETTNFKEYLQNSGCNHEVRLEYCDLFRQYKCVLCGETIPSNDFVSWKYSINRNKYCVNLLAKFQDDYNIKDGYTNKKVYEIIINILKDKKADEEIDLVQELKKLNLEKCKINEEKKVIENYILIISGSNKQFVDKESYLYKKGLKIGLYFIKYFSDLLNTKVELIDNRETLESNDFRKIFPEENNNLKFVEYRTIEDLQKKLEHEKDIPFKIIIDLSELYKYEICNNNITKQILTLKLNEYFPNSHLIRITNLSKSSLEELSQYLKNSQNYDSLYGYRYNEYCYLENDEIKSDNLENTCGRIKRLLRR